jgi:hypothetical protein
MLFLLLQLLLSPPQGWSSDRVSFPRGPAEIKAEISATSPPSLSIVGDAGEVLLRVNYRLGPVDQAVEISNPMRFQVVDTPEIGPLVIGVAGSPGGSDASFETVVIGEVEGSLQELLPVHLNTSIQDAVCVGRFGSGKRLGIAVATFIWGHEIHYAPHRYDVSLYLWNGRAFEPSLHHRSSRRHISFRGALAELGLRCRYDFVRALLPEFH